MDKLEINAKTYLECYPSFESSKMKVFISNMISILALVLLLALATVVYDESVWGKWGVKRERERRRMFCYY